MLSLLAAALLIALSTPRSDPVPKTLSLLTGSIKSAITSLRTDYFSLSSSPTAASKTTPDKTTTITRKGGRLPGVSPSLTEMPTFAALRDAALAVRHSAAFVVAAHDRELARDRSGRSGVHRDVLAEMRALDAAAGKVLGEAKSHVQRLKEVLGEGGWLDRILGLAFGGAENEEEGGREDEVARTVEEVIGGRGAAEEWAGRVVESWREGVKGWGMVKME